MLLLCVLVMVTFNACGLGGFLFRNGTDLARTVTALFSFRFNELMGSDSHPGVWNPLWSLSVEEMFYLAFPFVCLCLNGTGAVVWLFTTLIASSLYLGLSGAAGPYSTMGNVHLLAVGCVVALAKPDRLAIVLRKFWRATLGISCGMAGLATIVFATVYAHPFSAWWAPSLCGIGASLVLVSSQLVSLPGSVRGAVLPLSALGVVSYEAYLIHMPLNRFLALVDLQGPWMCCLAVFLAAVLAHECFSEPMNKTLRRRAAASGRKAAALESGTKAGRTANTRALPILRLAIAPVAAVLISAVIVCNGRVRPILLELVSIKDLPAGTVEPMASVGRTGSADLVYLRHEGDHTVRIGIDHWGATPKLSAPFAIRALVGA